MELSRALRGSTQSNRDSMVFVRNSKAYTCGPEEETSPNTAPNFHGENLKGFYCWISDALMLL
eukprot:618176-Amphidinium_carterae.1